MENTFNSAAGLSEFTSSVIDNGIGAAMAVIGVAGSNDDDVPAGYLNYILFDDDMSYVSAGWTQISGNANGAIDLVELSDVVMTQSGYVLAYLSNESNTSNYVHFDDFTIRHAKTNVVQAVDYYPFGMEAMTYTRTAADPTEYLYNGGVEKNPHSGFYETFYRLYDPTIGRFTAIDPLATSFTALTPYNYAANDPIYWNDPNGDCYYCNAGESFGLRNYIAGTAQSYRDMVDGRRGRSGSLAPRGRYDRWNSFFGMSGLTSMLTAAWHGTPTDGISISMFNNGRLTSFASTSKYIVDGNGRGDGSINSDIGFFSYGTGVGGNLGTGPGFGDWIASAGEGIDHRYSLAALDPDKNPFVVWWEAMSKMWGFQRSQMRDTFLPPNETAGVLQMQSGKGFPGSSGYTNEVDHVEVVMDLTPGFPGSGPKHNYDRGKNVSAGFSKYFDAMIHWFGSAGTTTKNDSVKYYDWGFEVQLGPDSTLQFLHVGVPSMKIYTPDTSFYLPRSQWPD